MLIAAGIVLAVPRYLLGFPDLDTGISARTTALGWASATLGLLMILALPRPLSRRLAGLLAVPALASVVLLTTVPTWLAEAGLVYLPAVAAATVALVTRRSGRPGPVSIT
ncbi:MAG: hypothetical protein ACR2FU_06520 [Streptosporangiaceae bacterium]